MAAQKKKKSRMSVLSDFHRSDLSPLVDQGRHHGHQFRARGMNSEWSRRENNGKILANGRSSSSSSTSGEEMNMIQLSTLGQNRLAAPQIHYHDLNDRKQLELMERTGYEIVQRNGQRIYGGPPPNWQGPPPCKGTEIFVGKIPREMFEWELVPIFEMCGFIYELRLMMDFSGSNRGYLFVRYSKREEDDGPSLHASCATSTLLLWPILIDFFFSPLMTTKNDQNSKFLNLPNQTEL